MEIGLRYSFAGLIKFAVPTICSMLCLSIYTIIDGIFVARYVGDMALASINIVYPLINFNLGIAIMLASGGCAVVAKTLGEGKLKLASQRFSLILAVGCLLSTIVGGLALACLPFWIGLLGSTPALYAYCYDYVWWQMLFAPITTVSLLFDYFLIVEGKPKLSFYISILGGATNVLLDYVFIVLMDMGISGAALATVIGYTVSGLVGAIYFYWYAANLHIQKFIWEVKVIVKACSNGVSEMISQLSTAVAIYAYNYFLLQYAGEAGVTAITIILYADMLLIGLFIGFSTGSAPIISYWYGAGDRLELRKVINNCYRFILGVSVFAFILAQILAEPVVNVFTASAEIRELAIAGFRLYASSFLFSGVCILASGIFTALSNGRISALISVSRNLVGIIGAMLILTAIWQLNGIWLAETAASLVTAILTVYFYKTELRKYGI